MSQSKLPQSGDLLPAARSPVARRVILLTDDRAEHQYSPQPTPDERRWLLTANSFEASFGMFREYIFQNEQAATAFLNRVCADLDAFQPEEEDQYGEKFLWQAYLADWPS